MLGMKHADHFFLSNDEDGGGDDGGCRAQANGFAGDSSFSEEVSGAKNGHDRLFATLVDDGELYAALLDIDDRAGRIALGKDGLLLAKFSYLSRNTDRFEIHLWIELALRLEISFLDSWEALKPGTGRKSDSYNCPGRNVT